MKSGEPAGTRTQGPRLKRAMLYRLSYRLTIRMLKKTSRSVLASVKIHASLFYKILGAHRLARRAQTWRSVFIAPCASLFSASRTLPEGLFEHPEYLNSLVTREATGMKPAEDSAHHSIDE